MSIKLHGVTSQQGTHITAVRSSDLNLKQMTPSDVFKDTLTIKLLTHSIIRQRQNNPITGLDRSWRFREVEGPRFQDNQHMKLVQLAAICTSCLYSCRKIPGTHFCWRLSWCQGRSVAGRILSMKNSSDTIGNQTHDLLACSAVFQPTAPLCAPCTSIYQLKKSIACTAKFL
jgi:hypothetical protein